MVCDIIAATQDDPQKNQWKNPEIKEYFCSKFVWKIFWTKKKKKSGNFRLNFS